MRNLKGIKCPFLRRLALCAIIVPAFVVYSLERLVEVYIETSDAFKDIWKGEK